jgi:pyroglutamyl-peptidase
MLWPDAGHTTVRRASIVPGADAQMFGPHTARLFRAALTSSADVSPSRDAGRYLCNYLAWRGIEAVHAPDGPRLAAFVHVPLLAQDTASLRMTSDELTDTGEAILLEMIRMTRVKLRDPARNYGV